MVADRLSTQEASVCLLAVRRGDQESVSVGCTWIFATGYAERGGELQEITSHKILIQVVAPAESVDRRVELELVPAPGDVVPVHLSNPIVMPKEVGGTHVFEGLIAEQDNRFGFAPTGGG